MIDHATIERIKDAANIVEVVSEFVTLRKSGSNYKGLCPFHDEKTPSFYVSPARGTCHCFGCGKGGNPVGFIMEHEQMTYPEALRWLARKYHIEIKERELSDDEKREQSERESMFIVNEWAASYFQHLMHDTADGVAIGMQYFRSRGFRDDIVSKFQLGFDSTDRRALAQEALRKGYKEDFLLKTGICYKNDRGELIDRYAGRVIFPWIGISGKVVGFGGRLLDSRTKGVNQKYVNSPDSEIYHKDRELYGIYQAKKAIAKEDRVYMVEGYTDVISMHQCGIENVVANSGTALSVHQIHILHRFTSNITLLYDGEVTPWGARAFVSSFGLPAFPNTNYPSRAEVKHALNLEVMLKNGTMLSFDFDVTDQIEAQPHGGVIVVKDIVVKPESGTQASGGFDVDVNDWGPYEDIYLPL